MYADNTFQQTFCISSWHTYEHDLLHITNGTHNNYTSTFL